MLEFNCYICKKELKEPGALLFSPPKKCHESEMFNEMIVKKYHICQTCFDELIGWVLVGEI